MMPQSQLQVFISYCRDAMPDAEIAKAIYESLHADCDVFFDTARARGYHWIREVDAAIQNSDVFLALVSAKPILKNSTATLEWQRALRCSQAKEHLRIIPISINYNADDLPVPYNELNNRNRIDWNSERPTSELVALLREAINAPRITHPPRIDAIDETVYLERAARRIRERISLAKSDRTIVSFGDPVEDVPPIVES